jgi:hypothetical protein
MPTNIPLYPVLACLLLFSSAVPAAQSPGTPGGGFAPATKPAKKQVVPGHQVQKQALAAAEFTFRVPMQFNNLHPEVTGIRLSCGVRKNGTTYNYTDFARLTPVNGAYNSTVTLHINVTGQPDNKGVMHPDLTNADMDVYYCDVDLETTHGLVLGPTDDPGDPDYMRVEPGSSHNTNAFGAIPW